MEQEPCKACGTPTQNAYLIGIWGDLPMGKRQPKTMAGKAFLCDVCTGKAVRP